MRDVLKKANVFNMIKRDPPSPKLPEDMKSYWLVGLTGGAEQTIAQTNVEDGDSKSIKKWKQNKQTASPYRIQ